MVDILSSDEARERSPQVQEIFVRRGAGAQLYYVYSKRLQRSMAEIYQLAFLTPGISPLYASSLKQIRQMP